MTADVCHHVRCTLPVFCRDVCRKHYRRLVGTAGMPTVAPVVRRRRSKVMVPPADFSPPPFDPIGHLQVPAGWGPRAEQITRRWVA